jgi:hypothetical protein
LLVLLVLYLELVVYCTQGCGIGKFEDGSGSDILSHYGFGSGPVSAPVPVPAPVRVIYMHIHIHVRMRIRECAYTHIHIHMLIRICACLCKRIHIHILNILYTYTIHIHVHIHIHYKYTFLQIPLLVPTCTMHILIRIHICVRIHEKEIIKHLINFFWSFLLHFLLPGTGTVFRIQFRFRCPQITTVPTGSGSSSAN